MPARQSFHWLDYVVFVFVILVSCGIGIYYAFTGSKNHSKEQFLMGNRKLRWLPVALSLLVSFNSGVVQLGVPAEIYLYGIQYWLSAFTAGIAAVIAAFTFLPLYYKLQLTSIYEYLELRFQSKAVRFVGSFLMITSQVIYIGIAAFSPAIALEAVTNFPVWVSIVSVGIVATFYTTLGGMKAVVWADAFQFIIMLGGMLTIIISGTVMVGGVSEMWEINSFHGRLNFFNFDPNPLVRMSFWSVVFGRLFSWLPFYTVSQTSVQRYCCVPTLSQARRTLLLNCPSQFMMDTLAALIGLVVFSYFSKCDPLSDPDQDQRLSNPNQLVPLFVMRAIGWPGVPGVFLASLFSGSLSTVSSCLNALAAVTWEDLLKWKFDYLSERTKTIILKVLVLFYGVCGVITAFLATLLDGSVFQVAISFLFTSLSPLMGLFILGAFFSRANWLGAMVGSCIGLAFPMWLSLGSYFAVSGTAPLNTSTAECVWNGTRATSTVSTAVDQPVEGLSHIYTISFMWFPTLGMLATVLVGLLVSLIARPFIHVLEPHQIKSCYLIFPLDRVCRRREDTMEKNVAEESELEPLRT